MFPQLIHTLSTWLPALAIALSIGIALYTSWKFRHDFPEKKQLDLFEADISDMAGRIADLSDRFSRFQKREGMRVAREAKETEKDLLTTARELVEGSQREPDAPGKLGLYKHLRRQ